MNLEFSNSKLQSLDTEVAMPKPLVSVIIPTYNRATLLQKALDSVYAQEGVSDKFEMEVIVVDDASSDDTPEVIRGYPGVRYIRLQKNQGEPVVRNAGIKASKGKYVTFLDDDDVWLPHKLTVQVPVLEMNPEAGVVYSQNIIKDDNEEVTWPDAQRAPSGYVFDAFLRDEWISMNTVLIRRDVFNKAGYFDESLATMTHYDMFLRIAFHFPFVFVPGNVAINHVNRQGVFFARLGGQGGYAEKAPYVVEKALAMLPDSPATAIIREEVHATLVLRIFGWIQQIGEVNRIRAHVRIALQTCPWMLKEPLARNSIVRSLRYLGRASGSPIDVVRAVCTEIKAAQSVHGLSESLSTRRLLADVWAEVASGLRWSGSRQLDRAAASAAIYAVLYDPVKVGSGTLFRIIARAVLGPRLDPIRSFLKTMAR